MRKRNCRPQYLLQCGRIYKDAEITRLRGTYSNPLLGFNVAASIKMRKFSDRRRKADFRSKLQCGRIYKDAEIKDAQARLDEIDNSFNVAASIKMRK